MHYGAVMVQQIHLARLLEKPGLLDKTLRGERGQTMV
jgi:hypothetical protein